jgi:hypothetical protein
MAFQVGIQTQNGTRKQRKTGRPKPAVHLALPSGHGIDVSWRFTEFRSNRAQTSYEREIIAPGPERGNLGQARAIMRQLGIVGEILWTNTRTDPNHFDFQVRRLIRPPALAPKRTRDCADRLLHVQISRPAQQFYCLPSPHCLWHCLRRFD